MKTDAQLAGKSFVSDLLLRKLFGYSLSGDFWWKLSKHMNPRPDVCSGMFISHVEKKI